ncbi:hypothetical protein ABID65_003326 [Bradyrhizobium sp. S3.9.2]|uniref:hypothetical protein n=1 Tax=Bradyrhizobium sp. S3.9.2 TaxID=3156432 RepID=UPI003397CB09
MSNFIIFAIVIAICGVLGWLIVRGRTLAHDGDWHPYRPATRKMRRWRGKWEYRDMTPEEATKHQEDSAW